MAINNISSNYGDRKDTVTNQFEADSHIVLQTGHQIRTPEISITHIQPQQRMEALATGQLAKVQHSFKKK